MKLRLAWCGAIFLCLGCVPGQKPTTGGNTRPKAAISTPTASSEKEVVTEKAGNPRRELRFRGKTSEEWKGRYFDLDPEYQKVSIKALTAIGCASPLHDIPVFLRDVTQDDSAEWSVRLAAYEGLSEISVQREIAEIIPASLAVLEGQDNDHFSRAMQTFLLASKFWSDPQCIATFREAQKNPGTFGQLLAALALTTLGESEFREGLKGVEDWLSTGAQPIGNEGLIDHPFGNTQYLPERNTQWLIRIVADEDSDVFRAALATLATWFERQAPPQAIASIVPQLSKSLDSDDALTRGFAATLVGRTGVESPEAISLLLRLLSDEHAVVRARAAVALGNIDISAGQAIHAMVPLLRDSDYRVRAAAATALGCFGEKADVAVESLYAAIPKEDWESPNAAAEMFHAIYRIRPRVPDSDAP